MPRTTKNQRMQEINEIMSSDPRSEQDGDWIVLLISSIALAIIVTALVAFATYV